jgi:hypothetical protein
VRDITQFQVQGLSESQIQEMRQFLGKMGIDNPTVTHPTTSLEDLFMRVVNENSPGGNGRIQAGA